MEHYKTQQSDVHIWWGSEPTNDDCYALFTIYFYVVGIDIGTPRFEEKVTRNLKALINIAERERTPRLLSLPPPRRYSNTKMEMRSGYAHGNVWKANQYMASS